MPAPRRSGAPAKPPVFKPGQLPLNHPTAVAFLDESGFIARDRFFAVGCLKLAEPSTLLRQIQKLRDRTEIHHEIHFKAITRDSLPFYRQVVDLIVASDHRFSCFVTDRDVADPVARFSTHWKAYAKLAEQLLIGSIRPRELLTVLADNYSAPEGVRFEQDVRSAVNQRLGCLGVTSVCRLSSKATDGLQAVDLITSAITHEFRQAAGLASSMNPKAALAEHVREQYGIDTCLDGCKERRLSIEVYGSREGPQKAASRRNSATKSTRA